MRVFPGIFSLLAAQALLAALVTGGTLTVLTHSGHARELKQRDRERLDAFVSLAVEGARAGHPVDQLVRDLDASRSSLAGRIVLVTPKGFRIAGSAENGPVQTEQPMNLNGRRIAIARLIGEPASTAADRRFLSQQYIGIAAVALALFLLLLGAGYIFAQRWSRSQLALHRLSRDVVDGELDVEIDETAPAEVAATMRNLRRIASQFERQETARRTWLVAIADELRQPAESLGEHFIDLCDVEPPLNRHLLTAIEQDTRQLLQLVEDLNAVTLADIGRLSVTLDDVDLHTLIDRIVAAHQHRAESQGVKLTAQIPESSALVHWDGVRIEQLFAALMDNALRYTPGGGRILLSVESARDAWRLIIDDSAPGVDVMLAQHLFEPFHRSADRSNESAASGLGLATARAIVDAHHGRIEASRSPIGGLRVTVVLPAEPPAA